MIFLVSDVLLLSVSGSTAVLAGSTGRWPVVPGLLPLKFFGTGPSCFLLEVCSTVVPVVPGKSVLPVHFPVVLAVRQFCVAR